MKLKSLFFTLFLLTTLVNNAQTFQDGPGNETEWSSPSRWFNFNGFSQIRVIEGITAIYMVNHTIISPRIDNDKYQYDNFTNKFVDNYLSDNFTLEFDAYFDDEKPLHEYYEIRFWEGTKHGIITNSINTGFYNPLKIYRHGAWLTGNVNKQTIKNEVYVKSLEGNTSLWRTIKLEYNNAALKIYIDGALILFEAKFHFKPELISIGAVAFEYSGPVDRAIKNIKITGLLTTDNPNYTLSNNTTTANLPTNTDGSNLSLPEDITNTNTPTPPLSESNALASMSTGLEALDEGSGMGWRLKGRPTANYGNIGGNAIDLSYSKYSSTDKGATGYASFAVGIESIASGTGSTAIGEYAVASRRNSMAVGERSIASGSNSFALGKGVEASGDWSVAIGDVSKATSDWAMAIGSASKATGQAAFAIGNFNNASGRGALAMGGNTVASGDFSTTMGSNTKAEGIGAMAIGENTRATGKVSLAMGKDTNAYGDYSTTMGKNTEASGLGAIATGESTKASGKNSTAFGNSTKALKLNSLAMGLGTLASYENSLVIGKYNDPGGHTDILFQIGNGTGDMKPGDGTYRANALSVFTNGHIRAWGYEEISDKRLKTSITQLTYGLNTILKLKPVAYNWRNNPEQTKKTIGLIAQEVQPIINEVVTIGKDKNQTLSLNYTALIPVLINAIQEQQTIIKGQNDKINQLSSDLNDKDKEVKDLAVRVNQIETLLKQDKL